jgi:adenylate kinase family enzyme
LACPSEKLEERLLKRAESGERVDDKSEAIVKRIEQFNQEYPGIVDYFAAKYPQQFKKARPKGSIRKKACIEDTNISML